MNLSSIKNLLHQDKLERLIKKLTYLMRIVLFICISISILFLITIITTGGQFDYVSDSFAYVDGIAIIIAYAGFYSFIYGTIPSIFLLIAIGLDNRSRKKSALQPVKTETKLLIINMIVVLIAVTIMTVRYFTTVNLQ